MPIVRSHKLKALLVWNSPRGRYDDIGLGIANTTERVVRLHFRTGKRGTGTRWGSRLAEERFPYGVRQ
jgi:hypothetical protein